MSISNLFFPNDYNLYDETITSNISYANSVDGPQGADLHLGEDSANIYLGNDLPNQVYINRIAFPQGYTFSGPTGPAGPTGPSFDQFNTSGVAPSANNGAVIAAFESPWGNTSSTYSLLIIKQGDFVTISFPSWHVTDGTNASATLITFSSIIPVGYRPASNPQGYISIPYVLFNGGGVSTSGTSFILVYSNGDVVFNNLFNNTPTTFILDYGSYVPIIITYSIA